MEGQIHVCILGMLLLLLLPSRFSRVQLRATAQTAAHQALLSLGFSRQEHWSGLLFPSPHIRHRTELVGSVAQSCLTVTPWTTAHQASLSITNSWSLLKLMSVESVMPSSRVGCCLKAQTLEGEGLDLNPNLTIYHLHNLEQMTQSLYASVSSLQGLRIKELVKCLK